MKSFPDWSNKTLLLIEPKDVISYRWEPAVCLMVSDKLEFDGKIHVNITFLTQRNLIKTTYHIHKPWWWHVKNLYKLFR